MPHALSPASSPPVEDVDDTMMSMDVPEAAEEDTTTKTADVDMEESQTSEQKIEEHTNLDDMFDDDDDEDDEFGSSAQPKPEESSQAEQ